QARLVAIVLVATMGIWLGAQWAGGTYGWETRYAYLFDLAALAAFFWALVVTFRLWRRQKANRPGN
ncbi:MAG: DUF5337 family protein, partial [Paracoccaceae bacterium]